MTPRWGDIQPGRGWFSSSPFPTPEIYSAATRIFTCKFPLLEGELDGGAAPTDRRQRVYIACKAALLPPEETTTGLEQSHGCTRHRVMQLLPLRKLMLKQGVIQFKSQHGRYF